MSEPAIGVVIPKVGGLAQPPAVDDLGAFGQWVEELGYESVWTSEGWGSDSFVDLTAIARHTDRVRVGTAVVNVFTRTPAGLAMAIASLDREADGRAVLGLGAGHPKLVENLHDITYERPLRRMHETIELVRALLGSDEDVSYEGQLFEATDFPGLDRDVPIYSAALGETNRRVTGLFSDGWLPYHVPFSQLETAFETVATAAEEAGRDVDDLVVNPFVPAAVSDDSTAARDVIRENLAGYIGAFTDDSYKNVVHAAYPDETEAIADQWRSGDESAAAAAVTDEMVDDFGVAGTAEEARARLDEIANNPVVDVPLVVVPHGTYDAVGEATIRALAPNSRDD
ncbi:LLM class flavin-dependent oxidoreductase [Haloferax sp. YSSS75]|uniref:LLM class flavin-dependent oxidoreductase n=1 Tax=Haloferax sp. YSSS75 TaxID=3388564 RepID=UPI00398D23F5